MYEVITEWLFSPWIYVPLGILLSLIAVLVYIILPLTFLKLEGFQARIDMQEMDFNEIELPEDVRKHFDKSGDELRELGFELLTGISMPAPIDTYQYDPSILGAS